jgi:hypothetical protein
VIFFLSLYKYNPMNKLLLFLFFYLPLVSQISSQSNDPIVENTELRKVRFGLYGEGALCWLTPDKQKNYSRGNLGLGLGWGLDVEINFNSTTTLRTGLNLSTFNAGINYYDDNLDAIHETFYVLSVDDDFVTWLEDSPPPNGDLYQLLHRKYSISYVNIPFVLKLKTNEVGYFTYFGEFGGTIGLKTGALVDDRIIPFTYNSDTLNPLINESFVLEDIDISKGTQPVRFGLNLGAGAEYSLSGSTSLFFQLNWNYFITNQLTKESNEDFLRKQENGFFAPVGVKSFPGNIVLSFGILF